MRYAYKKEVKLAFTEAVARIKAELASEGFGVLAEIDVKATLKKKLDVEYGNYLILGACNPSLALKAIQAEKEIGLFLPCNVIIYEEDGRTFLAAILPTVAMRVIENPSLTDIAEMVEEKLKKVIDRIP
jgi:uncharacterized protein (DUF302 family)